MSSQDERKRNDLQINISFFSQGTAEKEGIEPVLILKVLAFCFV